MRTILAILLLSASTRAQQPLDPWPADEIELRLNNDETEILAGSFAFPSPDFDPSSATIFVDSKQVPVVANRLTGWSAAFLESPLPYDRVLVVVKSRGCGAEEVKDFSSQLSVQVSNYSVKSGNIFEQQQRQEERNANDMHLSISLSNTTTTTTNNTTTVSLGHNSSSFLESSSLFRQLQCFSQLGPPCEPDSTKAAVTFAPTPSQDVTQQNITFAPTKREDELTSVAPTVRAETATPVPTATLEEEIATPTPAPTQISTEDTTLAPTTTISEEGVITSSAPTVRDDAATFVPTSVLEVEENATATPTTTESRETNSTSLAPTATALSDVTQAPAANQTVDTATPTSSTSSAQEEEETTPTSSSSETRSSANRNAQQHSAFFSVIAGGFMMLANGLNGGGRLQSFSLLILVGVGALFLTHGQSSEVEQQSSSLLSRILQSSNEIQIGNLQQQCTINVEVIYWGCNTFLQSNAPSMTLRNLIMGGTSDMETCYCTSLSTFPDINTTRDLATYYGMDRDANNTIGTIVLHDNSSVQQVPLAKGAGACNQAVGRPFRDQHGNEVSSSIVATDKNSEFDNLDMFWSSPKDAAVVDLYNQEKALTTNSDIKELAAEWTRRALGEHASIASFAAFTIALMANAAPPELIRDSLQAAEDEMRHAKVSFEVASLLASLIGASFVEPSPLPPSDLSFGQNLTALALGVIREGCFDETLSAFLMASQVDSSRMSKARTDESIRQHPEDLEDSLMSITRQITLEEGRHSSLAWRTIHWICRVDAETCTNIVEPAIAVSKEYLHVMGAQRLQGGWSSNEGITSVTATWACLHERLAGHTMNGGGPLPCSSDNFAAEGSLVAKLSNQIYNDVRSASNDEIAFG